MLVPLKLLVVHLAVNHRYFYTPCRSSNILFLMPSGSVSQGTYEKKFYVLVQLACPTKTVYSRSDIWSLFNQSQPHNFSQKATSPKSIEFPIKRDRLSTKVYSTLLAYARAGATCPRAEVACCQITSAWTPSVLAAPTVATLVLVVSSTPLVRVLRSETTNYELEPAWYCLLDISS